MNEAMGIVSWILQVILGAFVLFTATRLLRSVLDASWLWVALAGVLAIATMLLHRWLGHGINMPFFTNVLFAITLAGMAPDDDHEGRRQHKRAVVAVCVGTILGWLSFAQITTIP